MTIHDEEYPGFDTAFRLLQDSAAIKILGDRGSNFFTITAAGGSFLETE